MFGTWCFAGNTMRISESAYAINGHGMHAMAHFQVHDIDGRTITLRPLDHELANGKLMKVKVNAGGKTILVQSYFGDMDEWRKVL